MRRGSEVEAAPPEELKQRVLQTLERDGRFASRPTRRISVRSVAMLAVAFAAGIGTSSAIGPDTSPDTDLPTPRFLMVLHEDETFAPGRSAQDLMSEYEAWAGGPHTGGEVVSGAPLGGPGQLLNSALDGVQLGDDTRRITGFFIVAADDDRAAMEIARSCPHLRYGGQVAIYPVVSG